MNAESNYAIAIAALSDWFKNLAPVYQPMKKNKNKTNSDLNVRFFPRFEEVIRNCYECGLIALFTPAVIGQSNYPGIFFATLNRKEHY